MRKWYHGRVFETKAEGLYRSEEEREIFAVNFSIKYTVYILFRINVQYCFFFYRATIMQHETSNVGKGNVEAVSVAIPAVMRTGADGKNFQKFFPA